MRKVLLLLLCSFLTIYCFGTTSEDIKSFYITYMSNVIDGNNDNTILKSTYLTKALNEKLDRIMFTTDNDPLIRSQDINEEAIKSLCVTNLQRNWYMVSYRLHGEGIPIEIPILAITENDSLKIQYVCPEWNGTHYGDSLFIDGTKDVKIDYSTGLSFLQSFYKSYLSEYCVLKKGLLNRLMVKQNTYLTHHAYNTFIEARDKELADGRCGFDLLINNFDFDYTWLGSLTIKQITPKNYIISYYGNKKAPYEVSISIIKTDKQFLIDNIKAIR